MRHPFDLSAKALRDLDFEETVEFNHSNKVAGGLGLPLVRAFLGAVWNSVSQGGDTPLPRLPGGGCDGPTVTTQAVGEEGAGLPGGMPPGGEFTTQAVGEEGG